MPDYLPEEISNRSTWGYVTALKGCWRKKAKWLCAKETLAPLDNFNEARVKVKLERSQPDILLFEVASLSIVPSEQ